jgi:hypothetical protein
VREEEKLAAKDVEEAKLIRSKHEQAAAEARVDLMRLTIISRREAAARRQAEILEKAHQRWLQTTYPADLARKLIERYSQKDEPAKKRWEKGVAMKIDNREFSRHVFINDLWVTDKTFTLDFGTVENFLGGQRKQTRTGVQFQEIINWAAPPTSCGHMPDDTLLRLFMAVVPCARRLFSGDHRPLRLLHLNDYVLEKAFVYGIVLLSKLMGKEWFPNGVFGRWPPEPPRDLVRRHIKPIVLDDELPPNLRQESASASSGSAVR